MQLDPTLIAQINQGTIGAAGSNPSGTIDSGGDAPAVLLTVSDDSYADPSVSLDLTPVVVGGIGGDGAVGLNGDSPVPVKTGIDLSYVNAGAGQAGGNGGAGGAAEISMDNDVFGTTAAPLGGGTTINDDAKGGTGVGGSPGGNGGSAGDSVEYGNPVYEDVIPGKAGVGGDGGASGAAGDATNEISGLSEVADGAAVFDLAATGGKGLAGEFGGAGGDGIITGGNGNGGTGGEGAAGGNATSSLSESSVTSLTSIQVTLDPVAGNGGAGGAGGGAGEYYNAGGQDDGKPTDENTYLATNGSGGAGGNAGAATANLTNNTLTAPSIAVSLSTTLGAAGAGGAGFPAVPSSSSTDPTTGDESTTFGTPAGANGNNGTISDGQVVMTGNTLSVTATLSLAINTAGSGLLFNDGSGYDLTFSGNSLIGGGSSVLDVANSAAGTDIDALHGVMSIDGSADNAISGFGTFELGEGDSYTAPTGSQPVVVVLAPDPDTINLTPGHAPITIDGATDGNLVLNFDDYGGALGGIGDVTAATTIEGDGDTVINLPGDGAVTLAQFAFIPSAANVAINPTTVPCFAAGTRILTARGELPVEALTLGDCVVTLAGEATPIRWLGHRRYEDASVRANPALAPIRICAGAFGKEAPTRDLFVSGDHGICVGGLLIPARYLCNDSTIRQERPAAVTYFHIELGRHQVVLAEGLPAESYLDTGNRAALEAGGNDRVPDAANTLP